MPDEDDDLNPDGEGDSSVIRKLRADLKAKEAEAAEVKELRKELALSKAGLDLSPIQQKALMAAHEGDMDAEALRKTATDLGFAKAPEAPSEEPQVPAEEQEAHQRVQAATAAAEPADGRPDSLDDRIARAGSPAEIEKIMRDAGVGWNDAEV